jgi:hypothetical protein
MGSAVFVPVAQAVFQNTLLSGLKALVPGLNPFEVVTAGANRAAIESFPAELALGIVQIYAKALSFTFGVGVALAGVALLVALLMPWFRYHDESKKKGNPEDEIGNEAGGKEEAEAKEKSAYVVESREEKEMYGR